MLVRIKNNVGGEALVDLRNPEEHIQKWWSAGKFYEPKMLEWIRLNYSGGTFVDAGASVGNHTLFFALFCDCQVLAVEPNPMSFERLSHHVKVNRLQDRVTLEQVALSSQPGRCTMINVSPESQYNIGMFQLMPGDDIDVCTLDSLITKHGIGDVSLLKLDVEWYEVYALAGAVRLLEEQRPVIFVEAPNHGQHVKITKLLTEFGYSQVRKHNPTPTYEFICNG